MTPKEYLETFKSDVFVYKDGRLFSRRGGEGVRVVGVEQGEEYFGDHLLFIHPHIMDLFNYGQELLEDIEGSQVFDYNGKRNAFVVRF